MKVQFAQENVKGAAGLQDTRGFKIAANAHAFKMLSSGLYSDKVRAVLREIGCNAQDAHIEVGTPQRPIVVKLPNELDTQFYIQDWGPGLSHEAVMDLYSTYFASTKQQSNDFTGAFGLGSKSPFSYTDSFSVVSTHGGRRRTYAIYLDNQGAPTTSLMSEEDPLPDWPHGLRVGFPVKPQHYAEFQQKAQVVFQWFATPPEIRGASPIQPLVYKASCEDYRFSSVSDTHVLMGSVAYPLDLEQLGLTPPSADDKLDLANFIYPLADGLVIPVPIGTVQIAASREQLQYDKDTIAALRERCEMIMRRVGKEIIAVLESTEKDGWPAMCDAREKIQSHLRGMLSWNFARFGQKLGLTEARAEKYAKFVQRDTMEMPSGFGIDVPLRIIRPVPGRNGAIRTPVHRIGANGMTHLNTKAHVRIQPDTVIAYGSVNHAVARARKAVVDGKYKQVFLLTRTKDVQPTPRQFALERERLSSALGGHVPMVDVGTLDVPPSNLPGAPRRKKPKNWVPTLDAAFACTIVSANAKKPEGGPLGDVKEQLYMCLVGKSSWHRRSQNYRLFDTTDEEDGTMDCDTWHSAWQSYLTLSDAVGLDGPVSYAVLSAREVRSLYLKQLGWRWASTAVKEYVQRKDVRAALRKRCAKFQPVLPEYVGYGNNWFTQLAMMCQDTKYSALRPVLERLELAETIDELLAETKRRKGRSSRDMPAELEAYRFICQQLGVTDSESKIDVKDSVTLADMDSAFTTRFPRCQHFASSNFHSFAQHTGGAAAAGLLDFLTSAETKP